MFDSLNFSSQKVVYLNLASVFLFVVYFATFSWYVLLKIQTHRWQDTDSRHKVEICLCVLVEKYLQNEVLVDTK